MLRLIPRTLRNDVHAEVDHVVLADGQVVIVPRTNLAAAKELLALQKVAERRVARIRAEASENAQVASLEKYRGQVYGVSA